MVEANKGFQDKMFQLYTGASLKQVPASAPVPAFGAHAAAPLPGSVSVIRCAVCVLVRRVADGSVHRAQMHGASGASVDLGGSRGVDRFGRPCFSVPAASALRAHLARTRACTHQGRACASMHAHTHGRRKALGLHAPGVHGERSRKGIGASADAC